MAGAVAGAIMADQGVRGGVSITLHKKVPVSIGLGSSAASSVATAVGVDALFGLDLSPNDIIRFAGQGEHLASGAAHYDNVTASLVGGFVIVTDELGYIRIEAPRSLALCLVTPRVELPPQKTKYARALLPGKVPLEKMVSISRAASIMVHGFAVGSIKEIGKGMGVSVADESRAVMIPAFDEVRKAALSHGAAGVSISGAGPTLLATSHRSASGRVLRSMVEAFRAAGTESNGFVTAVGRGCKIIEEK